MTETQPTTAGQPSTQQPTEKSSTYLPTEQPLTDKSTDQPLTQQPTQPPSVHMSTDQPSTQQPTQPPSVHTSTAQPSTERPFYNYSTPLKSTDQSLTQTGITEITSTDGGLITRESSKVAPSTYRKESTTTEKLSEFALNDNN